jgi:hypothetical protein
MHAKILARKSDETMWVTSHVCVANIKMVLKNWGVRVWAGFIRFRRVQW